MMTEHNEVVMGLDVGGSFVKAGLVDRGGRVQALVRRSTGAEAGVTAVVAGITAVVRHLVDEATVLGCRLVGIGVGVPGRVDENAGVARYSANLGWRNLDLSSLLGTAFGLPVALGHDVRMAALAEANLGGRGSDSVFFLSIGTGVCGAHFRSGEVHGGTTGQAGEIGHIIVHPGGPLCGCGNRGCVEAVASAVRIAQRYNDASRVREELTAYQVVGRVRAGDLLAVEIWHDAVDALSQALASVVVLLDPDRIVIGGGLSLAGPALINPLKKALRERLPFRRVVPVTATRLGDQAGLVGAGLNAWHRHDVADGLSRLLSGDAAGADDLTRSCV